MSHFLRSDNSSLWISLSISFGMHLVLGLLLMEFGPIAKTVSVPLEVLFLTEEHSNGERSQSGARLKKAAIRKKDQGVQHPLEADTPAEQQEGEVPDSILAQQVRRELKSDDEPDSSETRVSEDSAAATGSGADSSSGVASGSIEQLYLSELRKILEARKEYPLMAQRLGHRGRVVVELILGRDGQVIEARILEPTRSEFLNRATEKLIRSVSALKPFPPEITQDKWSVRIPIEYLL